MELKGQVHKFGDNVNTDLIIPARYLNTSDPALLAAHCMEDVDPDFVKRVRKGDVIVAGQNFGCGSSREHAPLAIKASGVSCCIAETFARIFFRNAINIGLPIVELQNVSDIDEGDIVSIRLDKGIVINHTKDQTFFIKPFPRFLLKIIRSGGLMEYAKREYGGRT